MPEMNCVVPTFCGTKIPTQVPTIQLSPDVGKQPAHRAGEDGGDFSAQRARRYRRMATRRQRLDLGPSSSHAAEIAQALGFSHPSPTPSPIEEEEEEEGEESPAPTFSGDATRASRDGAVQAEDFIKSRRAARGRRRGIVGTTSRAAILEALKLHAARHSTDSNGSHEVNILTQPHLIIS